jgi:hypothetical protein
MSFLVCNGTKNQILWADIRDKFTDSRLFDLDVMDLFASLQIKNAKGSSKNMLLFQKQLVHYSVILRFRLL